MRLLIVCGCAVLFVLTDAQFSRRRQFEPKEAASDSNLIDIDLETDRNTALAADQGWQEGSGRGGDSIDDEDLQGSGSGSGDSVPDHADVDRPPTADAGPDVVLYLPENKVTLCGNRSFDDRAIVGYQWVRKTHDHSADMLDVRSVCVRVSDLEEGDYTFTLVVTDSGGNKATSDVRVVVKRGGPPDPLTRCQQLRDTSKDVYTSYVPRCTEEGDYDSLQCRGHPGTSTCWCADLGGREIPGTATLEPGVPDCEEGSNLPPCVFMLVRQLRQRHLLGAFKPKCTLDGLFQAKQCSGSMCYCVHKESGVKIPNTEVIEPDEPVCDGSTVRTTPDKGLGNNKDKVTPKPTTPAPEVEISTKINVNVEKGEEGEMATRKPDVSNESKGSNKGDHTRQPSSAAHIMTQPGILAAIIGGSVVVLLCAVLLVMFVVYRMRKKDEGSYALDEPKKMPNYSYQRAPDKEFYA